MALFPHNDKNKHALMLLFSDDSFRRLIDEIREDLKLEKPTDRENWVEENMRRLDEAASSIDLIEKQRLIQERFKSGAISREQKEAEIEELYRCVPQNNLNYYVKYILKEFNLPENFKRPIHDFIVYKNDEQFMSPSTGFSGGLNAEGNQLTINIFRQLDTKEFSELKEYINKRTQDFPKYKEINDIDTRLEIESAHKNKQADEYEGQTYKNTDIAEDYLGDKEQNKKVYDIVRSVEKLRHMFFGTSEKN